MRKLWFAAGLAAVLMAAPLSAQTLGREGVRLRSSESDGLFDAGTEVGAPFRLSEQVSRNQLLHTFSIQAIASGGPSTCTWNVYCTNKVAGRDTIAAGDYNSIGEVSGSPADLSCLANNRQRFTQWERRTFSTCYIKLESLGGGTSPAVEFYFTGVAE